MPVTKPGLAVLVDPPPFGSLSAFAAGTPCEVLSYHPNARRGNVDCVTVQIGDRRISCCLASCFEPRTERPVPSAPTIDEPGDGRDEASRMYQAAAWLRTVGYTVWFVGQRKAKGSGTSEGFPDSVVTHPTRWLRDGYCAVRMQEWKVGPKAHREEEQVKIAATGASAFVWDQRSCAADLLAFEEAMGYEPHPAILALFGIQTVTG